MTSELAAREEFAVDGAGTYRHCNIVPLQVTGRGGESGALFRRRLRSTASPPATPSCYYVGGEERMPLMLPHGEGNHRHCEPSPRTAVEF
nr:hypothetical protein Iba_scaffold5967CG0010 [Ipomoea batatas]GME20620.1 hypothetical protein Iba_scaffold25637CG0010 [Ipomoea batatas]